MMSKSPARSTAAARFSISYSSHGHMCVVPVPVRVDRVSVALFSSPRCDSVTSWPRSTSPSVSSDVIVSTTGLRGGIVVATGAIWAILMRSCCEQFGQHPAGLEVLTRDLERGPRA
jgi:hypothetical protein